MHMELFRHNPHLHHLQQPSISLLSDSAPVSGNAASLFMYQDINEPTNKLKVRRYAFETEPFIPFMFGKSLFINENLY